MPFSKHLMDQDSDEMGGTGETCITAAVPVQWGQEGHRENDIFTLCSGST